MSGYGKRAARYKEKSRYTKRAGLYTKSYKYMYLCWKMMALVSSERNWY
jgi:hypothetical protein